MKKWGCQVMANYMNVRKKPDKRVQKSFESKTKDKK
jgi:hypothetical protein